MTVPILIQYAAGQFTASLLGSPEVRCIRPSKDEAVAALQQELAQKVSSGELINLDVPPSGVTALAGLFAGDESLQEIRADIYRDRDADRME